VKTFTENSVQKKLIVPLDSASKSKISEASKSKVIKRANKTVRSVDFFQLYAII